MSGSGRDQAAPMERLTRILYVLASAQGRPVSIDRLVDVGGYGAEALPDRRDQVRRDIRNLSQVGWVITGDGPMDGGIAHYRLVAVDNRLRVEFTPEERFQLLRAARVADLPSLFDDLGGTPAAPGGEGFGQATLPDLTEALENARWAAAHHCLMRFSYKGKARVAHPFSVHARQGGWYLTAREDGDTIVKTFALARMTEVEVGDPGTSQPAETPVRPQLDPVGWLVDPRIDAVVDTSAEHRPQVVSMLGTPVSEQAVAGAPGSEGIRLVIPVTNRAAFRGRLYQLGPRARLVGPADLREQVRTELLAIVAAATEGAPGNRRPS